MTNPPILLVGAGGHARACIDVIQSVGEYDIVGLVGLPNEVGRDVLGYRVIGADGDLGALREECAHAIVGIGQIKTPEPRARLFSLLNKHGFRLPRIISPMAYVSSQATLGKGTVVMHGAIINTLARIGDNCIVNSQALVEHDTEIGDHCHVSTAAAVNSGVRVGEGTFIGSNTSVRQGTCIGQHCVIGMGQRVLKDCPDHTRLPPAKPA